MIEDGKKGRAVKSFTVAGNFFDLLKKITAVGNEIEEHCPGYTRYLCPDVLLCDMKVAGK
jgi:PmbA protein